MKDIVKTAEEFDFKLQFHKPQNCLMRFVRDRTRIDYWYTSRTVGIYEPRQKAKFLYNVSNEDLVEIFADPEKK